MTNNRFFITLFFFFALLFNVKVFAYAPSSISMYGLPTSTYTGVSAGAGGAGGVAGGLPFAVGASAFGIGVVMGYLGLDYLMGDGEEVTVRIPLTADPAKQIPAPDAPLTAPLQANACVLNFDFSASSYCGSTAEAACNSLLPGSFNSYDNSCNLYPSIPTAAVTGICGADYCVRSTGLVNSCSDGYILEVDNSCVLSNPRVVTPDNNCDISRTGSALAMLSDPDCAGSGMAVQSICDEQNATGGFCGGGGLTLNGYDSWRVFPRPDGGSDITYYVPVESAGYTPLVQTVQVGVGPDGTIDKVQSVTAPGTVAPPVLNPVTGNPVAPVLDPVTNAPPPAPVVQPIVNGITPAPAPGAGSITFPDDYARVGESSKAADKIVNKLDTALKPLTTTSSTVDPVLPDVVPDWGNTFSPLSGWALPAHASVCPTPSVDLSAIFGAGKSFTLDSHCQLYDDHKGVLQSAMMVVFSIMGILIILRA